ncbi:SpoIIE family protein phosphatase [Streptomyces sp. NPDC001970]
MRPGHHGPLLKRADGSCTRPYVDGGLPLGLSHCAGHASYPTTPLRLGRDDTLLLCTDGLVESYGLDIDEGLSQIETILRTGPPGTDDLAEHIVAIEARQGQADDVALLLVGLTGDSSPEERRQWSCLVARSDPKGPAHARQMLRSTLGHWGFGEQCDAAVTAANELIANALMHTDGDAMPTARVLRQDDDGTDGIGSRLRIEVQDTSSALPRAGSPPRPRPAAGAWSSWSN